MRAVHFGAGNIGRGFIGEILRENNFDIVFIDVNEQIINELKTRKSYTIGLADESKKKIEINQVSGLNNKLEPEKVVEAIVECDLITTAIGPNILPFIAELVARGINQREKAGIQSPIDIIACENMIGGSTFFKEEVLKQDVNKNYLEKYIGFPDAAVDRIVPEQSHQDPLYVEVEPFSEWVINQTQVKNNIIHLSGVHYVADLEPYIERKLFSVNTGHATTAYTGALLGYKTIDEAMEDSLVLAQLKAVLNETGNLLIKKWNFDEAEHKQYIEKIIKRFQNKYISDAISRVARTPIRKIGYNERFIRPIRELTNFDLETIHLTAIVGMIFNYFDEADNESLKIKELIQNQPIEEVISELTGIKDQGLIKNIKENVERYSRIK